jgi:hypothetical protein
MDVERAVALAVRGGKVATLCVFYSVVICTFLGAEERQGFPQFAICSMLVFYAGCWHLALNTRSPWVVALLGAVCAVMQVGAYDNWHVQPMVAWSAERVELVGTVVVLCIVPARLIAGVVWWLQPPPPPPPPPRREAPGFPVIVGEAGGRGERRV